MKKCPLDLQGEAGMGQYSCTKRLVDKMRSSLLLTIIYKCSKQHNNKQAYLLKLQVHTNIFTNTRVENANLIKGLGWLKQFIQTVHECGT